MQRRLSPPQLLALHIGGLIAAGTVLLLLPVSVRPGFTMRPINAFFTSASAVCVTGLIVIDTSRDLSVFGQMVVMLLIQAGGLGYMTISTVVAVALGRRITLQERLTLQEALNVHTREDLLRFAGMVLKMTLLLEGAAAVILTVRWLPLYGAGRAAYLAMFHSVSAFNNAGFSLFADNLTRFRGDLVVNLVIAGLIVTGGLGFLVLSELTRLRRGVKLSLHTRFTLVLTALLIAAGTAAIFVLERRNPATLGSLSAPGALLAALFQSVTARTAGFNTIDTGMMAPPTLFLIMLLMFIGASPGGTGGGVKTTTFGTAILALYATVRGRPEPTLFGRRLSSELVARAFFISLIAFLAVNVIGGLLLVAESRSLLPTLFETTSAFGTVGLSMGDPGTPLSLAGGFSAIGKFLLCLMMYAGRVGPLTLAVALAGASHRARIRYPEGKVLVG
jgi:trk system potassium uptake protein TrkH